MGNEQSQNNNMNVICGKETMKKSQMEIDKRIDEYLHEQDKVISLHTEQNQKNNEDDENLPPPGIMINQDDEDDNKEVDAQEKDHLPHPSIAKRQNAKPDDVIMALSKLAENDDTNNEFDEEELIKKSANNYNFGYSWFKFNDNSYYSGQWHSRKRNGVGTQVWIKDESYLVYEGFWEDDVPNIKGIIKTLLFDSKSDEQKSYSEYVGEIEYFRKEGHGLYIKHDLLAKLTYEYDGTWQMNKKDGTNCIEKQFIRFNSTPLYTYKGDFVEGRKSGLGKITFEDESVYEGAFKDDMMWGKGTYSFPNGQIYTGDFIKNQMDGKGRIKFTENKIYEGNFKQDYMHGKGRLEWPSNQRKRLNFSYDGDWLMGVQHGKGELLAEYKDKKKGAKCNWQYGEISDDHIEKPKEKLEATRRSSVKTRR